jgi:cell division transport system permease protein
MTLFFIIKEGIISLKRARLSAVITILSIALSLILLGLFGIIAQNVKHTFLKFYKQVQVEVFLDPTVTAREVNQLKEQISRRSEVARVQYISPTMAMEEFRQSFGIDIGQVLEKNPLPPSLRITLKPEFSTPTLLEEFVQSISSLKGVQEVVYQKEIVKFVNKYFSLILIVSLGLILLTLTVIVILIYNTIRLSIHSRRDIIHIMELVGATRRFIKSPFLVEGFIQGALGSGLAILVLMLFVKFIRALIFPNVQLPPHFYPAILGIGLFLGWMGSSLSVNKYLSSR